MNETKRFDLLDKYKAQDVARQEWISKYQSRVDDLNAKIQEKKVELEMLVTKEIQENADFEKEKVKLRKEIDSLKADLVYVNSEFESAMKVVNAKFSEISKTDVIKEWSKFRTEVYSEFSPEVIKKAELGMNLLMSAYFDQESLKTQYKDLTEEALEISKMARESGETSVLNYLSNPFEYFNTISDNIHDLVLAYRELNSNFLEYPDGFKYIEKLSEIKEEVK
ncbi:hypothetical protein [Bacillus sp. AFS017336]|uniref:hypothetical protein n=1 Tax=Bacillus sp. AFS017336 TaxID=2033489 RepID=UPI000BF11DB1|nr:hypothetical protein [Bacillus sp. AFS017336]PEL06741.1 hypothetical protein CN601_20660 [Bacillus sp. AFS017336]